MITATAERPRCRHNADNYLPPDPVLRQLLEESSTAIAATVIGITVDRMAQERARLNVEHAWAGRKRAFHLALSAVIRQRWAMWQTDPPAPLRRDQLEQLVKAQMAREGAAKVKHAPMKVTGQELLAKLWEFKRTHNRWPGLEELAAAGGWPVDLVKSRLWQLRQMDEVVWHPTTDTYYVPAG